MRGVGGKRGSGERAAVPGDRVGRINSASEGPDSPLGGTVISVTKWP